VSAKAEGRHVLLTVANDVSHPLTEEQCRQLFDRFYRADPPRNKDRQSGFGIGLAIAAAIAEKHGGSMNARMDGDRLVISALLPKDHKPETPGITFDGEKKVWTAVPGKYTVTFPGN
jgi:signal transduction histidine kinase